MDHLILTKAGGGSIDYADVIDLGFKREDVDDPVWEVQYGYPYFLVHKDYPGGQTIEWDVETHVCTLWWGETDKEKTVCIGDLETLKLIDSVLNQK